MEKEAHVTKGVRKILENPKIWKFFNETIIGQDKYQKKLTDRFFNNKGTYRLLDIGCGTCDIINHLDENIEYYGFDLNDHYITSAKKTFGNRGTFIKEVVGENLNQNWIGYFDVILAHGLIHHLTDTQSHQLLKSAKQYLKKDGFLVTVDTVYHEQQNLIRKFLVSKDRGQNVRTPSKYLELAKEYFNVELSEINDYSLRIPYSLFTMKLTH